MLLDIFNYCEIDKTPVPIAILSEKEFAAREPVAVGSRSGKDGNYGAVSLKRTGLSALFGRETVYVRLTKDNVPRLRELNLDF